MDHAGSIQFTFMPMPALILLMTEPESVGNEGYQTLWKGGARGWVGGREGIA